MSKTTKTSPAVGSKTRAPRAPKVTKTPDAPKVETTQTETPPVEVKAIRFHIAEGFRPTAGDRLFAHTAVFLETSGMLTGTPVPSAHVRTVLGARAIKWHTGNGNFEDTPKGLALSEQGKANFAKRKVSAELKAAFEAVLQRGELNDAAGIKNPIAIKAIKGMDSTPADKAAE
jgi:hypothetical protein